MADQIADKEAVASSEAEYLGRVELEEAEPRESAGGSRGGDAAATGPAAAAGKEGVLSWTEERVEQLRRLWLDGLSASRIATELAGGVTRNAVIGKVHRLGLSGRVKAPAAAAARQKPAKAVEAAPPRPAAMPVRGNIASEVALNSALAVQHRPAMALRRSSGEDRVVSMIENVTIMDLRESMCRWPVGDPSSSEFRYCGGKAPIGEGPYCKLHSRMAYQPAQDRRQRKTA